MILSRKEIVLPWDFDVLFGQFFAVLKCYSFDSGNFFASATKFDKISTAICFLQQKKRTTDSEVWEEKKNSDWCHNGINEVDTLFKKRARGNKTEEKSDAGWWHNNATFPRSKPFLWARHFSCWPVAVSPPHILILFLNLQYMHFWRKHFFLN